MKKMVAMLACVGLWQVAEAQVNFAPFFGINTTKIHDGIAYENGGTFVVAGLELEFSKKPARYRHFYFSAATGGSYLSNGFYYSGNFAYTALNFYTQRITDLRMQYIQIPALLRVNWQPFPLVEDWKLFVGLGVVHNLLVKSTLEEKYTEVFLSNDVLAPPEVTSYADARDVTGYGKKRSWFRRVELGMKYKRLQLSYRISTSLTDLYRTDLEKEWKVPDDKSWYIEAYQDAGKTVEQYSELVVGFRF